MDPGIYRRMREVESGHWWFRARRRILARVLAGVGLPPGAAILDAGCGTGGNLALLSRFGVVTGLELDADARRNAAEQGAAHIVAGSLPDDVPFADAAFDLVTLLDVLEHIDADAAALARVARLLRPGGWLLVTVPAYAFLWSRHDEIHHHKRRYLKPALCAKVVKAGLTLRYASYFNTWLLPVVAGARGLERLLGQYSGADLQIPHPLVNGVLEGIFASERLLIGRLALPVGVSILALAQRPAAPS